MVRHARTGAVGFLIACLLVVSQVVLVSPASAAAPDGPTWVPAQSVIPSSKMSPAQTAALMKSLADSKIGTSSGNWHLQMQTAASRGAYVPGLSDAARTLGVSPYAVTPAQASASYSNYVARPGSASNVAAQANSRGLVSYNSVGKFTKAGGAFAAVAGGTAVAGYLSWELGTAVGHGIAKVVGLPTSGSVVCDFMTLVSDDTCGLVPDDAYVPNSDVVLTPKGWVGSNITRVGYLNPSPTTVNPASVAEVAINGKYLANLTEVIARAELPGTLGQSFGLGEVGLRVHVAAVSPTGVVTNPQASTESVIMWGGRSNPGITTATKKINSTSSYRVIKVELLDGPQPTAGVVGTWYPEGSPDFPPEADPDPLRHFSTAWTCTDGSRGVATSPSFRESDAQWAPPTEASCAAGEVSEMRIYQVTEPGLGQVLVYEWSMPQQDADFLAEYPQCAAGECLLDLRTTKTGVEVSCFQSPELCTDWVADPNRDTDFQCYYAGEKVVMADCFLYGPTFNPRLVAEGSIYGDPETGQPLIPEDAPDTGPGTGTGGGNQPPEDPNCPPAFTITSLVTPWWYWKGVTCALDKAFVPTGGGAGGVASGIFLAYQGTAAGGLVDATKKIFQIPLDGTCGELFSVKPSVFGGQTFAVDTCSAFWTGAAPIRTLLGVSMVLFATIAGLRLALGALGITMFDGKGQP